MKIMKQELIKKSLIIARKNTIHYIINSSNVEKKKLGFCKNSKFFCIKKRI